MNDFRIVDGDLVVDGMDFAVGEASGDLVERLAMANQGEFKMSPKSGFGLIRMINAPGEIEELLPEVIEDLKRNLIEYKNIDIDSNGIKIEL